ncbi:expressed unknown protein [Seminavis robusta]|uniref:Uncharacterized protein n=1 Tax=Seminavis robusta TaxID=568900 RepID=A0A9N8F563_9STRA|nr:expressed unknown protein [Seminavis robusta]|eukprot:Sro4123_g353020.1 n/a (296) ;mRNA; f:1655-2542
MTMATPDQGMLETASTSTVSKDYSRLDVDAILKGVEVVEGLQDGLPNQDGGDGTTVMDVSTKKMEEVSNKLRELMDESAPDSSYQAPDLAAANLKAMEKISIRGSHESLVDKLYQKAAQKQRQPDRIKPVAPANTGEKKLRPVKSFGNMPVVPAPSKNSRRQTALPNRGALRRTSSLSGLALKAAVGGLDALKEEEKRSKARKMRDPLSTSLHHGKASSSSLVSSSRTHKSEKSAGSSKSKRIIRKTASLPEEANAPDVPRSQSPRRNTVVSLSPTRKVRRSSSLDPKCGTTGPA